MNYKEETITTITYGYNDLLPWIKAAASRQLNLSPNEITEEMINVTPESIKQLDITVTFSKTNTNVKPSKPQEV